MPDYRRDIDQHEVSKEKDLKKQMRVQQSVTDTGPPMIPQAPKPPH